MSGTNLGDVGAAVHLLVIVAMLVVEVCLQGQLGAAVDTAEAATMEECVVLHSNHIFV